MHSSCASLSTDEQHNRNIGPGARSPTCCNCRSGPLEPDFPRQLRIGLPIPIVLAISLTICLGQIAAQEPKTRKYSAAIVDKAESILQQVGLRRSGKSIQFSGNPEISRAISGLTRQKRELRLTQQRWQRVVDELAAVRDQLQKLHATQGELGLQLARVAGVDVTANNRIVGLIEANKSKILMLADRRESLKEELLSKRKDVSNAEARYSETVLAIRRDYDAVVEQLNQSLMTDDVRIALGVMHVNFGTPETLTSEQILSALDKRIGKIESEVFTGTIPLDVAGNSLFVDVVVGKKTARMVVDSGAEMVCLPLRTANELGIEVSIDAREMRLMLADGREIPAHAVTIPAMRIGEFEVKNVPAAVLDVSASDAEPLLGMSFLGNFKFEIDQGNRTLKLLKVE